MDRGKKFRIQESGAQNVKIFVGELFALFTPMFSYILQKDDPESKIILQNRGTKHGLKQVVTSTGIGSFTTSKHRRTPAVDCGTVVPVWTELSSGVSWQQMVSGDRRTWTGSLAFPGQLDAGGHESSSTPTPAPHWMCQVFFGIAYVGFGFIYFTQIEAL